jgi:two-component system chemotaxis sensor kinase CheA
MKDKHAQVYQQEANELLEELEAALLELKDDSTNKDLIGRIFRALHTIKGSGAMFGFDNIVSFTHDIENIYDLIRNDKLKVTDTLTGITLDACDIIRDMLGGGSPDASMRQVLQKQFTQLISRPADGQLGGPSDEDRREGHETTWRIRFRPRQDIFATGVNPALLLAELKDLGPCRITSLTDNIPMLEDIDPESCYISWDIVLTTDQGENAIRDVFIFVEDRCDLFLEVIDWPALADDNSYKKLGEILTERGDIHPNTIQKALGAQKRLGEILTSEGHVTPERIHSALAEQEHVREMRARQSAASASAATIRVPAERLDTLVDMVGELVTVQSRLSQLAERIIDTNLALVAEEIERLTAVLRDNTMSIRMLPISNTFSKFKRLVYDLSKELGKDVRLITQGGETELDKTVIEKLNDPLVHLIRNSIDHGIEAPDARAAGGKPRAGMVKLSAEHSGAHVLIKIEDDGAGIDAARVRHRAVEKNLLSPDAVLSETEILSFILAPGFSLSDTVSSVSGRGVGMDVVKKSIDSLGGTIEIASRPGAGSTITLKLPLTLAIIDSLLVKTGDSFFVVPLASVEECVELSRADIEQAHGRHVITVRDEIVPYIPLRKSFAIAGAPPEIEQIIISSVGSERIGIVVDQVVGEHQTVIKNLGKFYRDIQEVSGATILGDGTVALILDVAKLAAKAEAEALVPA